MKIPVFIRQVPSRRHLVDTVVSTLTAEGWPGPILRIECSQDPERSPIDRHMAVFTEAMRRQRWRDSRNRSEGGLHMEDDIELVEGFTGKMLNLIEDHPGTVIQGFNRSTFRARYGSGWNAAFTGLQCFYLPKHYADDLLRFQKCSQPYRYVDGLTDSWMRHREERVWVPIPSLVQHLAVESAIDPSRPMDRQAKDLRA